MSKDYGQFCGLAKAAAVLGERWALLILRDLSVGPSRFGELQEGLPGIPTTVLTTRLRELEAHGVVTRRPAPLPQRGLAYQLTDYGRDLAPILDSLGRWGARRMASPDADDVMTPASLAAALRTAYRPGVLPDSVTIHVVAGPVDAWARTERADRTSAEPEDDDPARGTSSDAAPRAQRALHGGAGITVGTGAPDGPADLTITTGPQMRALLAGHLLPDEALQSGAVTIDGPTGLFHQFADAFHVPLDQGETP